MATNAMKLMSMAPTFTASFKPSAGSIGEGIEEIRAESFPGHEEVLLDRLGLGD